MQDIEARDTARYTAHRFILHNRKTSNSYIGSANVNSPGEEKKREVIKTPWDLPARHVGDNAPVYFYNLQCVFSVFFPCFHLPSAYIACKLHPNHLFYGRIVLQRAVLLLE